VSRNPSYFKPDQFSNPANPAIHRRTTAEEIWNALDGRIDAFVAGVGTGGTITGCGEVFKERNQAVRIIAVEPSASPVLSGGAPGPHKIQGIGAGFVPDVLNQKILDRVIAITDDEAYRTSKILASQEGLFGGISSGANVAAAQRVAAELGRDQTVVTILCDTGERYLSMGKYFAEH
jgi:cysteine synthase A